MKYLGKYQHIKHLLEDGQYYLIYYQDNLNLSLSLGTKIRIILLVKYIGMVGSGLSDSRNGLNRLFDLVIERKINKVIIENKDRLTRYQFNVLSKFFNSYGVEIETIDNKICTDEEELTNDIMMLMAVFSGKLYGRRSAKRRKEQKQKDVNENNII